MNAKPEKIDLRARMPRSAHDAMAHETIRIRSEADLRAEGKERWRPVTPGVLLAYWACYMLEHLSPEERLRWGIEGKAIHDRLMADEPPGPPRSVDPGWVSGHDAGGRKQRGPDLHEPKRRPGGRRGEKEMRSESGR